MDVVDLYADDFFRVRADPLRRVVRLFRSTTAFPSLEELDLVFLRIMKAVTPLPHEWRLLIDSRNAPLRNDPGFEASLGRAWVQIVAHFARSAVVVQSATGKLQVSRYTRENPKAPRVFDNEAEAIAYLTAP